LELTVLAADQRLRRADDFATVMRRGRRAARDGLVVHMLTRDEPGSAGPRAGFVVPRAVGPAVTRNLVRRRLRHLLRDELPRLRPGTDLVVRVQPSAAASSFEQLREHLRDAVNATLAPRTRGGKVGTQRSAHG
jgi:ribonuclease P protein component